MKLETKLGGSVGILVGAMLLSATLSYLRILDANQLTRRVTGDGVPLTMATTNLRSHLAESVSDLDASMLFVAQPEASQNYRKERALEIAAAQADLNALVSFSDRMGMYGPHVQVAEFQGDLTSLRLSQEKVEHLMELHTPDSTAHASAVLHDEVITNHDRIAAKLNTLLANEAIHANEDMHHLSTVNNSVGWALWTTTILGAGFGSILSFILGRRIVAGLHRVAERADAIAAGDLTGKSLVLAEEDQIGSLGKAMNRMQENIGSFIRTASETAGSLTTNAVSMRCASDHIHHRIDQQTQQTQQAASAMQEMSASIAEVSRHTQTAAETSRSAAQTAREGGAVVQQLLCNMQIISREATETSEAVGLLSQDSKRIGQIVTVIGEIARKTNLLALNAAIEAARAGDQGRGFAVVAGEVRRLAESTAQATGEIAGMIQVIQNRALDTVASMKSSTAIVEQQVGTANQAGEALERIIGMAERVDRMIAQIAIAASQQASVANQSAASLEAIHALSNENLSEMAGTAAGIELLRSTAVTLEQQVDRFNLEDRRTAYSHDKVRGGGGAQASLRSASLRAINSPDRPLASSSLEPRIV